MSNPNQFNSSAVNASECLSQGWKLLTFNLLLFVGMFVVLFIISFALGLIPYVGSLINVFISGPLTCGILMAMLAAYRNENPPFSMMFEGFTRFLAAVLIPLVQAVPWFVLAFFAAGYAAALKAGFPLSPNGSPNGQMPFDPKILVPFAMLYLGAFVISMTLKVLLFFALPLVADRNLNVVEALKLSFQASINNIGGIIVLILLEILIIIAGTLMCFVGLLIAIPLVYAAEIIAYKQVFPDLRESFGNEPPRPDAYGGTYGYGQ